MTHLPSSLAPLLAFAFLLAGAAASGAAERVLEVSGAACDYKIRFDPAKVDEKRLGNTARIILGDALPSPDFQVRPPTDVYSDALVRSDQERCVRPIGGAQSLDLLDMPGLADLRARKIEQTIDACAFEAIKGQALIPGASAAILREHAASGPACGKFIQALEQPGLTAFWRDLVNKRCVTNGNPAQCRKSALSMEMKPNGAQLIRQDVITYDWSNCAIEFLKMNQQQKQDEDALKSLTRDFMRRFRTKAVCQDGD